MIREILPKNILTPSRVAGVDYTICPYIGCLHRCIYCYVRFMRFIKEEWGKFLYVKINGAELLRKKKKIKEGAKILISTATDPYQPAEKKYKLTRAILRELTRYKVGVSILTKSSLVVRDIDILVDLANVEVGFSITTIDEQIRKLIEPAAVPIKERLSALAILKNYNIKTYVFIAPILPKIIENTYPRLLFLLKNLSVDRIVIDKLNYADRLKIYGYENFHPSYFDKIKQQIINICKSYNIPYYTCF